MGTGTLSNFCVVKFDDADPSTSTLSVAGRSDGRGRDTPPGLCTVEFVAPPSLCGASRPDAVGNGAPRTCVVVFNHSGTGTPTGT